MDHSRKSSVALAVVVCAAVGAQVARAQRPRPSPAAQGSQAQWKGVWEPVNYDQDVELNSVYFTTADEGWIGGGTMQHGVLLHTVDGGAHWDVALGDPEGSQPGFRELRFVDQMTGFAVQKTGIGDHTLLRTTDGAHWQASGTVPQSLQDYRFLSATTGIAATGREIRRTTDGGRTWSKVFECALKIEVQGLPRNVQCEAAAFAFPSATVGYALGNSPAHGLYILKTADAGESWTVALAVPDAEGREGHIFFNDEQTGYVCTAAGQLFGTTDAGASWTGLPGATCESKAPIQFADHDVGWTLRYHKLTYTTDGGQRWSSRDIRFPASVNAFSLPRRDRAYAVGDHGMVYRYRVVPAATAVAASSIGAPAMPGLPTALATDVVQLQGQLAAIDSGFAAFVDPGAGANAAPPAAARPATPDGASPLMTKCCTKRLATLGTLLTAVGTIVPDFTSRYRNLNLLTQGLRTASALPDATSSLKSAVQAFRSSGDKASAVAALAQIKSVLATLRAATDTALQKPTFVQ